MSVQSKDEGNEWNNHQNLINSNLDSRKPARACASCGVGYETHLLDDMGLCPNCPSSADTDTAELLAAELIAEAREMDRRAV